MSTPASSSPLDSSFLGRQSTSTLVFVLVLCAAVPYLNTLANGFVYDDLNQLVGNPYLRSFRYVPKILTTDVWSFKHQGEKGSNYYRPVMMLGYLGVYKLFGAAPFWFHLMSVALHVLVVWMLFLATTRLFANRTIGFVAAAAFALHPIHTESVAWVAGVADLELAFFFLLAFWLFLGSAAGPEGRPGRRLAAAGSFALALLSKEPAVTFPMLATLYEHFYRGDRHQTSAAIKSGRYSIFWLLTAAYLALRLLILGEEQVGLHTDLSLKATLLSGIALCGQYFGKLLWPMGLVGFYVFEPSQSVREWPVLGGLAALAASGALFVWLWRRARVASFALLWIFLTLGPVLNARLLFVNVFAERYLYLPSVGFCWLVAWFGVAACERLREFPHGQVWIRAATAGAVILALLCALRIALRNRDWENDYVFYTRTLQQQPAAFVIRANLGKLYAEQGDFAAAEREFREGVRAAPDDPLNAVNLMNLGSLFEKQGQSHKAAPYYERAIAQAPENPYAHTLLGTCYLQLGMPERAELHFLTAVNLAPRRALGHTGLGRLYRERGDLEQAEAMFRHAIAVEPVSMDAHYQLARLLEATGRIAEAIREYEAVLKIDPNEVAPRAKLQQLRSKGAEPEKQKP